MIYIALSVVCSVVVSVLLKLAPRHGVDVRQAITGNYLVATLLALALLDPRPSLLELPAAHPAWRVLVALGVLLPSMFMVLAYSVRRTGVVVTDAAQRLSLLLPLLAAFTLFGEAFSWRKGAGMAIGLAAIACLVLRKREAQAAPAGWQWPLIVFAGMGAIDILFKRVAQLTGVPFADVLLATFALAFVLAMLATIVLYASKRMQWQWRNIVGAVLLGVFNFGNILFYVQAHRHLARDPALVFSAMNIGVIVLATLVGVAWLGERLGHVNRIGLALAVAAVLVLATA
ncbi:MAG TPA: EamA/RhaT family transporter [Rhodanobacteraceae bacterium]|nr:EamA/RhaT family transporter [Rhodanobacteraceae bacterium]